MQFKSQNTWWTIIWYNLDLDLIFTDNLLQFVQDHLQEDPALLLFKYHRSVDFDLKEAVQQIAARQKAKHKLPTWAAHPKVIFPSSLSLEQSSSEVTAQHKASIVQGERLIDLTGGFGVDTFFMGEKFKEVICLERQEKLGEIVRHNFGQLSIDPGKYKILIGDSVEFLKQSSKYCDWLYIDPARRGESNQKLFKLVECEPDVRANWGLMKENAHNIMIKTSPMLDIKAVLNELSGIQQVMVVAVKNEVKEILLLCRESEGEEKTVISAMELMGEGKKSFEFTLEEEADAAVEYSLPQSYFIEPHAAILKSGAFKIFSKRYDISKLHTNTHLYTASGVPEGIMGRIFKVIKEVKLDKKELKQIFPSGMVNVIVRNHPVKPRELKKKYQLKDGGEEYLIATTTLDGKARAFWCSKEV